MNPSETLEKCKAYLGETWLHSPAYRPEDNPAHRYREGAYWLLPENADIARELSRECAP